MRNADLIGADLSGADLSGADLSYALVYDAQFGGSLEISENMKFDLRRRGAIFEDSPPGDRDRSFAPIPR
ncbi:MAG: pentapeptide repeat-containing protein [Symploca sp. SIO2G7]|nr:pentapeptide repeat-containing protein [Symploca sp. SIO2G7]